MNRAAGPLPQEEPPTNAAMRLALSLASEVAVASVGMSGDPWDSTARFTVTGDEVAGLAQLLAIVDGGTGDRCRCWGSGPALLLRGAAGERVAQWTLHLHQDKSIRGVGNCDAELRDGPGILRWLAGHGLAEPLEAERLRAHEAAEREERRAGWVAAAPRGLAGAAEAVSRREEGAEARLADAVRREYPAGEDRVLALLAWAGFPARHAGGTPWHELAPQRMLLEERPEAIFAALASRPRPRPSWTAPRSCSRAWTGDSSDALPSRSRCGHFSSATSSAPAPSR